VNSKLHSSISYKGPVRAHSRPICYHVPQGPIKGPGSKHSSHRLLGIVGLLRELGASLHGLISALLNLIFQSLHKGSVNQVACQNPEDQPNPYYLPTPGPGP